MKFCQARLISSGDATCERQGLTPGRSNHSEEVLLSTEDQEYNELRIHDVKFSRCLQNLAPRKKITSYFRGIKVCFVMVEK